MSHELTFEITDPITSKPLGTIDPVVYSFNSPIWGGGECEMTLTIPKIGVDALKFRTQPDRAALYIRCNDTYIWGGPVIYRSRVPGTQALTVRAQNWESYFYTRLIPHEIVWRNKDEYWMANRIMEWAIDDFGMPPVVIPGLESGKTRDLTTNPWWSIAEALDNLGKRDNGYEWSFGYRPNQTTGNIEIIFELWQEGDIRSGSAALFLDQSQGSNRITVGEIPEDATERRPRVWATGEGQPPDQPKVKDEDPELSEGLILLRETETNRSGVVNEDTLFEWARAERLARNLPFNTLPVDLPGDSPSLDTYRPGDRARLRIRDDWEDIDISGIRISDRAVSKDETEGLISTVTLDMLDVKDF